MVSGKKTKHLVLADLAIDPNTQYPDFHLIIQGVKEDEHPEIDEILRKAGGKNQEFRGRGKPEYIIRLKNEEKVLLLCAKLMSDFSSFYNQNIFEIFWLGLRAGVWSFSHR
jgi:hypothetical protein